MGRFHRSIHAILRLAALILLASCASTGSQQPPVVIDGEFDDWKGATAVVRDPADAPDAFVDFGEIRVRHDRDAVYMTVELGKIVTAQRLPGTVMLLLDVDGDPTTGYTEYAMTGVDLIFDFPLPNAKAPGTPGAGIRVRTAAAPAGKDASEVRLNPYALGFVLAPVHAGDRLELRFDRRGPLGSTPPIFQARKFRGKLVAVDLKGKLVDETAEFSYELKPTDVTARKSSDGANPLARPDGTDFRVMSWNVNRGSFLENTDTFARILAAIGADVIILDEVPDTSSPEKIRAFLAKAFLDDRWNVYYGKSGNDQRTVVATRQKLVLLESFDVVHWPAHAAENLAADSNQPGALEKATKWLQDSVPTGGALVKFGSKSLVAAGIDTICCGGYKTVEDHRRMIEAAGLNSAIAAAEKSTKVDAVVVSGDFNLVGDPVVLDITGKDVDPRGGSLVRAKALQLDGLTDSTWANADEPFVPGRLDNMLYSSSSLVLKHAFVFDSSDISARWLSYLGLRAGDSSTGSDHMPVVGDFAWK